MNENENTTTQNLWDTVNAVLSPWIVTRQAPLFMGFPRWLNGKKSTYSAENPGDMGLIPVL